MRQEEAFIGQKVRAMGTSTMGTPGDGRIGEIDEIFERGTASVDLPDGNRNVFWLEDLESVVEMKIGDQVKVMRAWQAGEQGTNWGDDPLFKTKVGKIGKIVKRLREDNGWVVDIDGDAWLYPEFVLQKVDAKSHVACILTERVMVNGVKCRKIIGFEGIWGREELPGRYTRGKPAFWQYEGSDGHFVVEDEMAEWICSTPFGKAQNLALEFPDSEPRIKIDVPCLVMAVGSVWTESDFQNILIWLKRAGSRLAKIKRQEHDAWTGQEEVSI
ncbi:hypothetical protein M0R72_14865 [Candidatus Pacearchaeota archaeon]|jgi:hypothetical protein|nr:hypothetical protein [Candidatus Pacearchaeota archaeon]